MEAHRLFDELWRSGQMTRQEAYRWLAKKMGYSSTSQCHFSEMNLHDCVEAIEVLNRER
jgi:uncharacterized protein DUF3268